MQWAATFLIFHFLEVSVTTLFLCHHVYIELSSVSANLSYFAIVPM